MITKIQNTEKNTRKTHEKHAENTQKNTNNNDNNDNNDNKAVGDPLKNIEDYYLSQVIKRITPGGNDLQSIFSTYDKYQDDQFIIRVMKEAVKNNIERNGKNTIKSFNYFIPILKKKWEEEVEKDGKDKQDTRKADEASGESAKRAGVISL